jgi:molybdopterin-guanine dinucleotide biosynthesis protein A
VQAGDEHATDAGFSHVRLRWLIVSAAILTGGQATRFGGRDKSALVVGGRSILDRQLGELSSLTDDVMIVSQDGARAFPASRVRTIRDLVPGCGPLGGLHAALTAARDAAVFVVACDMPYVTAALAEYLLSLAADVDVVVPRTERGYHPLCAVYTRACLEPAAARLAERRLALHELLAAVTTRVVTDEELSRFGAPSRLLANVNTPAEYASLEALQGHKL